MTLELIMIAILISINGFFALSEIAFVSSRREHMENAKAQGSKNAALVLRMMDTPDRFLSCIQVGITLIGILAGVYGGIALADDISKIVGRVAILQPYAYRLSLVVVVGMVTYLSIVFGELVPKTLALRNPEKVILSVIPIINTFSIITSPIITFLSWSTTTIVSILGIRKVGIDHATDPILEILGIAKSAVIRNKIDKEQAGIIMNAANIRSLTIDKIMVKRQEMRCLSTMMSLGDALVEAHIHHHTRYPLCDEADDNIIGYVNFKDIVNTLRLNPASPTLRGICRPIISSKNSDSISIALRKLISTHQHIALVRDSANQVIGMITMENILETIVGDIKDEYDVLPEYIYNITEKRFLVGGGISLDQLKKRIDSSAIPQDNRTLDLWIRETFGSFLKPDTAMKHQDIVLTIRKVSRSHIYEVVIDVV